MAKRRNGLQSASLEGKSTLPNPFKLHIVYAAVYFYFRKCHIFQVQCRRSTLYAWIVRFLLKEHFIMLFA